MTLAVTQACCHSLKRLALGTHSNLGTQPLQHRQSRDNDGSPPQFVDPSPDKANTAIGLQSGRYQPGRKERWCPMPEGAQPIVKLQLSELRERTRAGLESARGEGRIGGRRPQLLPLQQTEALKMVTQGKTPAAECGSTLQCPSRNGMARSNSANEPTIFIIIRAAGVVVDRLCEAAESRLRFLYPLHNREDIPHGSG